MSKESSQPDSLVAAMAQNAVEGREQFSRLAASTDALTAAVVGSDIDREHLSAYVTPLAEMRRELAVCASAIDRLLKAIRE